MFKRFGVQYLPDDREVGIEHIELIKPVEHYIAFIILSSTTDQFTTFQKAER